MNMVKVIFTNGMEMDFHGSSYTHNAEHKMFCIPSINNPKIMIPDHMVACVGQWDTEKEEFVQ